MSGDYGMPLSVGYDTATGAAWIGHPPAADFADDEPAPVAVRRPRGVVQLRDNGGTLLGEIADTRRGLAIRNARLNDGGGQIQHFGHLVFVPWSSVLYWSITGEGE